MNRSLLFVIVAAGVLSLAGNTFAGDAVLSPKAQALADSLRKVPVASEKTPDLAANRPAGNAKGWELARSFRRVPSTGPSIDLAHGPRPTFSPKDPRYQREFRHMHQIEIAPLK